MTEGFGAVFTSIAGAAVAANLALIGLDVWGGRSRRGAAVPVSAPPSVPEIRDDTPGSEAREADLVPAGSATHVDPA